MANDLTIFDNPQMSVPSHLKDFLTDDTNLQQRTTVPSLSYEGKTWQVSMGGRKTPITRVNEEGEEELQQVMKVVILDYAKSRGRAYYSGAYDPSRPGGPLCWSEDGVRPHSSVATPQCEFCKQCPRSVRGSRTTESGRKTTECSEYRMLAIVPAGKVDSQPLRMKIAVTSDWDVESEEHQKNGWFAFTQYRKYLAARNVGHTARVVTKMKFDPKVPHPKILFSPDRWINDVELEHVSKAVKSENVKSIVGHVEWTPSGVNGEKIAEPPKPAPATFLDAPDAHKEAPKAKPEPRPTPPTKEVKAKVKDAATPKVVKKEDTLDALLSEWGDA